MSKLERKSGGAGGNEKAGGWGAVGVAPRGITAGLRGPFKRRSPMTRHMTHDLRHMTYDAARDASIAPLHGACAYIRHFSPCASP
jgi:hypothetical protein